MGTERFVLNYLHVSKNEVGHEGTFRLLILLAGQKVYFRDLSRFILSSTVVFIEPSKCMVYFYFPTVAAKSSRLAIRDQNDLGDRKGR